jgi:hypothetical protein
MAFDLGIAAETLGSENGDVLGALGSSFGVPNCMLEIAGSIAAQLLPSAFLGGLAAAIEAGKQAALDLIAWVKSQIYRLLGLREDFNKVIVSIFGQTNVPQILGTVAGLIGSAAGFGAVLTQNYQAIEGEIQAIKECLNQLSAYQKLSQSSASVQANADPNYSGALIATAQAQIRDAETFINKADAALSNINEILYNRSLNPDLEPVYLDPSLSAYGNIAAPTTPEPVFRLVFGPPKSKKGQFLLSVDGLYYDSQKGGIPSVSGVIIPEEAYKFNYPANLGGKGSIVSLKDLNAYIDTVFDLSRIDESPSIQEHYKADHFLQVLQGQRDKHLYDVSAQIAQVIADGNSEDSAIVINMQEGLNSIAAQHESKINRRKKQIEVAIKSPYIAGKNPAFGLGKVPINDFSFLKDLNFSVAYEQQKKLVFEQGEVSDVVLPLKPKFIKAQEAQNAPMMQHLVVPIVGKGAIIYDNDGIDSDGTVMSLTDSVVPDKLLSIYNFLQGEVVTPGSSEYKILNCASSGNNINNAQLVGLTPSAIYSRGLAIPYLTGITKLTNTGNITSFGNYVRLPNTQDFFNLAYKKSGFTFESWIHLPYAGSAAATVNSTVGYGSSSLHRVLLACENTGGVNSDLDPYKAPFDNSIDVVRGLVVGFTRDRQITSGLEPTNTNNPAESSVFYIAPTRSINTSNVSFINKSSVGDCATGYDVLKLTLPLSSTIPGTTKKVFDVSSTFMHFAVTVDPLADLISIYVDGVSMKSASLTQTFNLAPGASFNVPSFAKSNSFSYSLQSTGSPNFSLGPTVTANSFTPWILGGGFTDGNKANVGDGSHGFMGLGHGLNSGLNGYVGSVKFYSKPLSNIEVQKNYDSQKGFFKNIDLT